MKRQVIGVLMSLVIAAAFGTAQIMAQDAPQPQQPEPPQQEQPRPPQPEPPQQQPPSQAEVTLTGCLMQGPTLTSFVLDKAKASDRDDERSYDLVSKAQGVDLAKLVNHQVRATGTVEQGPRARLTATSIVSVADTCGR